MLLRCIVLIQFDAAANYLSITHNLKRLFSLSQVPSSAAVRTALRNSSDPLLYSVLSSAPVVARCHSIKQSNLSKSEGEDIVASICSSLILLFISTWRYLLTRVTSSPLQILVACMLPFSSAMTMPREKHSSDHL